jgi:dienelactone hydrolase
MNASVGQLLTDTFKQARTPSLPTGRDVAPANLTHGDLVQRWQRSPPHTPEELSPVKVSVQIHHGLADQSVPSAASENTANALRMQKTAVDLFLYPGCDHGFLAYTRPFYNAEAGVLSWQRTTDFLERRFQQQVQATYALNRR